jgi:hypothetical protein
MPSLAAGWKQDINCNKENFRNMKKYLFAASLLWIAFFGYSQQNNLLTQQEINAIAYMREEEKLARDVYTVMFEKWDDNPFDNIRQSEQVHMDRIKTLITSYSLEDPVIKNNDKRGLFTNTLLQEYYNELFASGNTSLTEALKAGAKIEEMDIADLAERTGQTKKQDIITTFNYLKQASENHLRAFVRRLKMQGVNYVPVILSVTEFDKIIADEGSHRGNGRRW